MATLPCCRTSIPAKPDLTIAPRPADGYHTLTVTVDGREGKAAIIAAPARIPVPEAVAEHQRWGWMTQMYSVRSRESLGIGDYGDLKVFWQMPPRKSKADFMLINPIHAGAPIPPLEPSPYLPESRRFLNVTYIRPQDIPEYATLPADVRAQVDALHDSVAARNDESTPDGHQRGVGGQAPGAAPDLRSGPQQQARARIRAFQDHRRPDLDSFATWCLCFEVWGAPWGENRWFFEKTIDDPAVRQLVEEHHDLFEFNRWLRWIAAEQVNAAQQEALDHGMTLGLMQDMAVGVHGLGARMPGPIRNASPQVASRSAARRTSITSRARIGASHRSTRATWRPPATRCTARWCIRCTSTRARCASTMCWSLFRLVVDSAGLGARNGAYVTYNHEAMLGVLAIEATRAGGMVVGEDLGTVPDYVRRILADHGVLGTDVEWFNRVDDSPNAGDPYRAPKDYRKQALASVTTHDLPPTAGYLNFAHVKLREELHLLSEPVEAFAASAMAERTAMMNRLVENGYISQTVADDVEGHVQEIVEAMHAMLTDTPSLLLQRWWTAWRMPLPESAGHFQRVFRTGAPAGGQLRPRGTYRRGLRPATRAVPSRRDAPREKR